MPQRDDLSKYVAVIATLMLLLHAAGCIGLNPRVARTDKIGPENALAALNQPEHKRGFTDEPAGACGSKIESDAVDEINRNRLEHQLPALACNLELLQVARFHSDDMANRDFFDHENPDGDGPSDRLSLAGLGHWSAVAENIAQGQWSGAEVSASWMDSPGHRENMLSEAYNEVAVGVAVEGEVASWTALFVTF